MNIKPLADRVLVLPAQAEEKVGGIIIPDTAKEKPQRGKVVAVGNGTKDEEMTPCSMANMLVQSWRWMARNISSCARAMCSPW